MKIEQIGKKDIAYRIDQPVAPLDFGLVKVSLVLLDVSDMRNYGSNGWAAPMCYITFSTYLDKNTYCDHPNPSTLQPIGATYQYPQWAFSGVKVEETFHRGLSYMKTALSVIQKIDKHIEENDLYSEHYDSLVCYAKAISAMGYPKLQYNCDGERVLTVNPVPYAW